MVATFILGWDSGFHVYLLTLLPLVFFFDPWPVRVRTAVSLVIVVFYVAFAWYSTYHIGADLRPFVEWFRYGNLFIGAIVLAALSYYYGAAVGRARADLEAKNVQLDALARTDALTGLANRREALGIIELERVRAFRASESFSIGLVDIDHFKQVNDEHGHSCGDVALRAVSDALRATLRAQDTVARWGGEEFLLVLPATDLAGARVAAEKVRAAVADTPVDLAEASIRLTVTIGLAVVDHTVPLVDVLKRADEALYAGKDAGRDRVELAE